MRFRSLYVPIIFCLLLCGSAFAETNRRIPIPDEVFYYQPAASVFGSEAAWVNPAGLGTHKVAGFQLMAEYERGDYARSWGATVYHDRLTTAYRHIDNPEGASFEEYVSAAGFSFGPGMNMGLSYRYFNEGPGIYNNRHFWTAGVVKRDHGPFAFGAVFSNLNRGKIEGERSAMEQRYSVAYRPLGNQLTLAADMFLSTRNKMSEADFVYHARYTPVSGLYLNAYVDSDRNFQVGFRTNLLKYFVGSKSSFDRNGHNGRTTAFFGATNQRQSSLIPESRRSLALTVSGRSAENPPQPVFGTSHTPFVSLLSEIYRAAEEPRIGEMIVNLRNLALGFGQAQELRQALDYFRAADKRIICHITSPNNIAYYVASVADSILVPPVSQLRLVGLRAELTYWAGTLDKLGVKIELLRVGEYKTAPESYTRTAGSEENREQTNRLLDDLYQQFVGDIALGRGISRDSVRRLIDQGPFTSQEALEAGLVDGLSYRDNVKADFGGSLPEIAFKEFRSDTLINDSWQPLPVLAVVVAEGDITSGSDFRSPLDRSARVTLSPMSRALSRASRSPNVRGIVLRINSPGGYALAGEKIYHEVGKAAERKPLIVSMANVTASGGYYMAMPAARLFANPATITGSIGIYGGKADFSSLYNKVGVGKELYTRGKFAGMLTDTRPFTEEERSRYLSHLEAFYDHFVDLVAANRDMNADTIDVLSRGRVWTGREALANGLIDNLGGVRQALDYLAEELGIEEYRVEIYPRKRPWFLWPGSSLLQTVASLFTGDKAVEDVLPPSLPAGGDESILARMPFDIVIE
ncbi:MAG: signal peptide peptidase SppA [bacterium]|nr:signal peptide peptidase SppA [bacterium]